MTRMGSASHLGDVRRYSKGIRASKKSILYSDYFEDDKKDQPTLANQRSISLSALHQGSGGPLLEPRMARLETLEAKMASIEVSLSTTPRRKKSLAGGSLGGVSTVTPTPVGGVTVPAPPSSPSPLPVTTHIKNSNQSKDIAKELERLRNTLRDKENVIHSLKGQLWNWNGRYNNRNTIGNGLGEKEKKTAQERLSRLKSELDSKRLAIKNIKLALDAIDLTDNIDVRIQQAELEYQLGREELNLLSLLEESRNLQNFLEETNIQQQTIFGYVGRSSVSLHCVELTYDPKSPQFGAGTKDEGGLYVEWAVDNSGLQKGDRLLEVNGKLVLNRSKEEMCRLLSVSPSPAQVVVMRKKEKNGNAAPGGDPAERIVSELKAELTSVREKAGEAERLRDSFRSDNVRLSHRISYLEEQVAELLDRARAPTQTVNGGGPQVFQKGSQKVALVGELPEGDPPTKTSNSSSSSGGETRSIKSIDVSVEKPKRKKELSGGTKGSVVLASNSSDTRSQPGGGSARPQPASRRYSEHLHGEPRQRHIREARSSLVDFIDKRNHFECDSEPGGYSGGGRKSGSEMTLFGTPLRKTHHCDSNGSLVNGTRPVPPKKPIRLSLHKAKSLQSVDSSIEKKSLKRTHKGEAPLIPPNHLIQINGHLSHGSNEKWC